VVDAQVFLGQLVAGLVDFLLRFGHVLIGLFDALLGLFSAVVAMLPVGWQTDRAMRAGAGNSGRGEFVKVVSETGWSAGATR
jgi:hypothetical protein